MLRAGTALRNLHLTAKNTNSVSSAMSLGTDLVLSVLLYKERETQRLVANSVGRFSHYEQTHRKKQDFMQSL